MKFYFRSPAEVLESTQSSPEGLTAAQHAERLQQNGPNKLMQAKKKTLVMRFLSQLTDPMVLVLAGAAIISGVFHAVTDMIIILAVVVINGILGVVQEGKAEKAIEALQKMTSPTSRVRRGGQVLSVKAEELTVGDIVLLEAGDSVPADMRLLESASLKAEEASLTGESVPVDKKADALSGSQEDEVPLGDRANMVYMGSSIAYGRATGVVVATGMDTEMGKIAHVIMETKEEKTPLQKKLAHLGHFLSIAVLVICVLVFAISVIRNGGFQGDHVLEAFMTAISLAVAAIPEGLVAVVTIVLSIGVTKMSKRNAIIRRLTAVETLGCTQIICSDKTGTLTQNKMTVTDSYGNRELLATAVALCSDAALNPGGHITGEPTESALVAFALSLNLNKNTMEEESPRVAEAPFDSMRKMMSTIHRLDERYIQYTKGAPDEVLARCTHIFQEGGVVKLTDALAAQVMAENKRMAGGALRVLAGAYREYSEMPDNLEPAHLENGLVFIGLAGMIDPVRPEVKTAIEECRTAGIRPIMITGDHKDTAVAIAKELGIITDESMAITGAELSRIPEDQFEKDVVKYSVYARVQPEHKVRIVAAWKKLGKITAMTGDGVNDAPALKTGDIGVAMGITGTDVTKNVSDMVLADDNFATIVYAVEEGRRIYDNIRKAIQFLLATNLSEVVAVFTATLLTKFALFMPIHILWINLVTDSLPAIALGMEPAEADVMKKKPRSAKEGIFADGLGAGVLYQGVMFAVLTLASFFLAFSLHSGQSDAQAHGYAMTMAFVTLSMCEVFHSLNMRSRHGSIFSMKHQNKLLWGALALCFVLTIGVVYTPVINDVFYLVPLDVVDFATAMGLAFAVLPIVELVKLFERAFAKRKAKKAQ